MTGGLAVVGRGLVAAVLVHGHRAARLGRSLTNVTLVVDPVGRLIVGPGEGPAVGPHGVFGPVGMILTSACFIVMVMLLPGQHLGNPQRLLERRRLGHVAALAGDDQGALHVGVERAVEGVLPGGEGRGDDERAGACRRGTTTSKSGSPCVVDGDRRDVCDHRVLVHEPDAVAVPRLTELGEKPLATPPSWITIVVVAASAADARGSCALGSTPGR